MTIKIVDTKKESEDFNTWELMPYFIVLSQECILHKYQKYTVYVYRNHVMLSFILCQYFYPQIWRHIYLLIYYFYWKKNIIIHESTFLIIFLCTVKNIFYDMNVHHMCRMHRSYTNRISGFRTRRTVIDGGRISCGTCTLL